MRLDRLFNAVMARLELLSGTSAKLLGDYTTHGKGQGNQPPRVDAPGIVLRRRYEGCRSDAQRREVIRAAIEELGSALHSRRRGDRGTKQGRLEVGADPRPLSVVVRVYNYSERHVRRCRQEWREEQAKAVRRQGRMAIQPQIQVVRPEEAYRFTPWPPPPNGATASRPAAPAATAKTAAKQSKQEQSSTTAPESSEAA